MKYDDYYKKKEEFYQQLFFTHIDDSLINEFHEYGIGINQFSDKYINNVINILVNLSEKLNNIKLDIYIREIRLINRLFDDYYKSNMNRKIIKYIDKNSITQIFNINEKIACEINFSKIRFLTGIKNGVIDKNNLVFLKQGENILINNSNIIKYYMYLNKINFEKPIKLKRKYVSKKILKFLIQSEQFMNVFSIIIGMWKLNCIEIFEKDKYICFKLKDTKALQQSNVCDRIYLIQQEYHNIISSKYQIVKSKTKFGNFISNQEYSSYIDLVNIFYNEKLDDKMLGVEYSVWLRALALLVEKIIAISRSSYNKYNIFVRKESFWINFFNKNGIKTYESVRIIDELKFRNKSIDYFDSPFISTSKGLAVLPWCVALIKPSRTIEAIMIRTKTNNEIKGKNFENYIYHLLNKNNIQFIDLEERYRKEDYQCDLIFIYKNEIFFCELKNDFLARSYEKYIQWQNNIKRYVNQITRLYNFYKKNINVENRFCEKYTSHCIYNKNLKSFKMIIFSHTIGKSFLFEDVIITDIISFRDFLSLKTQYSFLNFSEFILSNIRYRILTNNDKIYTKTISTKYSREFYGIKGEFLENDMHLDYYSENVSTILKKASDTLYERSFLVSNCSIELEEDIHKDYK